MAASPAPRGAAGRRCALPVQPNLRPGHVGRGPAGPPAAGCVGPGSWGTGSDRGGAGRVHGRGRLGARDALDHVDERRPGFSRDARRTAGEVRGSSIIRSRPFPRGCRRSGRPSRHDGGRPAAAASESAARTGHHATDRGGVRQGSRLNEQQREPPVVCIRRSPCIPSNIALSILTEYACIWPSRVRGRSSSFAMAGRNPGTRGDTRWQRSPRLATVLSRRISAGMGKPTRRKQSRRITSCT